MKKSTLLFLLMLPSIVLFWGCPVGIKYSPGNPGTEKIDEALLGVWEQTDTNKEIMRVRIAKKDNFSYSISILERGSLYAMDGDDFEGWVTTIKGKKILFSRPLEEQDFYMYEYSVKGKTLTTHDVALLDGGIDAVTSTESLRKQIETSLDMEGGLSEETVWKKE